MHKGTLLGDFQVFKAADGQYWWIAVSSTAFEDRDEEVVSTKALAADCDRADQDGDYGPLRWWHIPGVDIGDCRFNAMSGRSLIEMGTFRHPAIARAAAEAAPELELSIGFKHLPDEPGPDGVYNFIHRFERSLVPRGRASNLLTAFAVVHKESEMKPETKAPTKRKWSERRRRKTHKADGSAGQRAITAIDELFQLLGAEQGAYQLQRLVEGVRLEETVMDLAQRQEGTRAALAEVERFLAGMHNARQAPAASKAVSDTVQAAFDVAARRDGLGAVTRRLQSGIGWREQQLDAEYEAEHALEDAEDMLDEADLFEIIAGREGPTMEAVAAYQAQASNTWAAEQTRRANLPPWKVDKPLF